MGSEVTEVNGVRYFLGFNEEVGKWQVLTPTLKGIRRIDVVDDEALPFFGPVVWEEPGETSGKTN